MQCITVPLTQQPRPNRNQEKKKKKNADCVNTTGMDKERMLFLHHPMDAETHPTWRIK
jgi:hypothetical protein